MTRPKVLIYRAVDEGGASHRALEAAGCEVVVAEPSAPRARLLELASGAHVLLGATFPAAGRIDGEFFAAAPELRLVSKYTIGVDDVDVERATALGILVAHCPTEANWGGVAEGTLAAMLTLLKKVRERDRQVKQGGWRSPGLQGIYVGARDDGYAGLTIGIVGLGRIGGRVAELLRPWRVRVLAVDPYVDDERFARCGAKRAALPELLATADVVTLHCNLTAETRGMIGAAELARMKPNAILINTARGALLDLAALCDALEDGRLAGAALDVFPEEPLPPGARIAALGDRVLLSPHMIAANQGGTLGPAVPWATEAALAALRGEVPRYVYNEQAITRWRERFGARPLL